MKNNKAIDYEWIETLQWPSIGAVNIEFVPVEELQARFTNFYFQEHHRARYGFLAQKNHAPSTQSLRANRKLIHSLAKLGYVLYFGSKRNIKPEEFQRDQLKDWVKEYGLPVYTAQFPYHRQITNTDRNIRNGIGSLRLLIDNWPVELSFELNNPEYSLMFDTTLRALAIDAFLLYAEVCLIFDPVFKEDRKRKAKSFRTTVTSENPLKTLFELGQILFAKDKIDQDIQLSIDGKLPPQFMATYGGQFLDYMKRMFGTYASWVAKNEHKDMVHHERDATLYLEHVFSEIENYMYRVHLKLNSHKELGDARINKLNMVVTVPDLLSLCWLELFLLVKAEGFYGLRVCKAADCPQVFFPPSREDQLFCSDPCRSRHNIKEKRKQEKMEKISKMSCEGNNPLDKV